MTFRVSIVYAVAGAKTREELTIGCTHVFATTTAAITTANVTPK